MKYSIGIPIAHKTQAAALVYIYLDGFVLVTHGGCELGQGLYNKMIQNVLQTLMASLHPIIRKNPKGK
ncbi:Aldehyde oxidase 4 [Plecturocebus cupreus]